MEDARIVDLYWRRDEAAIVETQQKYGVFCRVIANNILSVNEDAEECVNDTYHKAWVSMPPQRPVRLGAWLGRVVRNTALNLWSKNHARKRYGGMDRLLSELEDCIPSSQSVEQEIEGIELAAYLNSWLASLSGDDRILFMRRYWYGEALGKLAGERGVPAGKLAQRMYRLRLGLREALEKEGVVL